MFLKIVLFCWAASLMGTLGALIHAPEGKLVIPFFNSSLLLSIVLIVALFAKPKLPGGSDGEL